MEEIVTVNGRQYKSSYDQQLTAEQKTQVIENIRRSEHNIYGQTNQIAQLENGIKKIGTLSAGMNIT